MKKMYVLLGGVAFCFFLQSSKLTAQEENSPDVKKEKEIRYELAMKYHNLTWDPYLTDGYLGNVITNNSNSNKIYYPSLKLIFQEKYLAEMSNFKYYLGDFKYYYSIYPGLLYPEYRIRNLNREETEINFIRMFKLENHSVGAGAGWKRIDISSGTDGKMSASKEHTDDRGVQLNVRYSYDLGRIQFFGKYDYLRLSGTSSEKSFNLNQGGYLEYGTNAETKMGGYKAEFGVAYSIFENLKIGIGFSKTFLVVEKEKYISAFYYPGSRQTYLSYNPFIPESRNDTLKGFYFSATALF